MAFGPGYIRCRCAAPWTRSCSWCIRSRRSRGWSARNARPRSCSRDRRDPRAGCGCHRGGAWRLGQFAVGENDAKHLECVNNWGKSMTARLFLNGNWHFLMDVWENLRSHAEGAFFPWLFAGLFLWKRRERKSPATRHPGSLGTDCKGRSARAAWQEAWHLCHKQLTRRCPMCRRRTGGSYRWCSYTIWIYMGGS